MCRGGGGTTDVDMTRCLMGWSLFPRTSAIFVHGGAWFERWESENFITRWRAQLTRLGTHKCVRGQRDVVDQYQWEHGVSAAGEFCSHFFFKLEASAKLQKMRNMVISRTEPEFVKFREQTRRSSVFSLVSKLVFYAQSTSMVRSGRSSL